MRITQYKAWVAFFGSVLTALLASDLITNAVWIKYIAGLSAIVTAIVTYQVPFMVPLNKGPAERPGVVSSE